MFASLRTPALPVIMAGQLPRISFRGLLDVHSRYGPRDTLAPIRSLFSECFNPFVTSWIALSASGWNISFPAGTFTREAISTFQDTHNNRAERALRIVALGRKRSLFAGSSQHAQNLAVLHSIVATCRMHKINAYEYIKDMLIRTQTHPASRIDELMPWRWRPPSS